MRQHVHQTLLNAYRTTDIDEKGVGAHTGRRSVVTSLFTSGLALDDVARHVGHASTDITARYAQDLGSRPAETARIAAELLDPAAQRKALRSE